MTFRAVLTALGISAPFLLGWHSIFRLWASRRTISRIGGGLVLPRVGHRDLLFSQKTQKDCSDTAGGALGTPLIIGPVALTTILMLSTIFGALWTMLSLGTTDRLAGVHLRDASRDGRTPGDLSNVQKWFIFLAAIGVMMIRQGSWA